MRILSRNVIYSFYSPEDKKLLIKDINMKKIVLLIGFLSLISACSNQNSEGTLPELNAYSDDQNYVLERMQWLGFDPSIVSTQELKDGLSVIFGYGGNVLVSVGDEIGRAHV